MPRSKRYCPTGIPVHVIQRGNNKQACFTCAQDIKRYIHWLSEGAKKYAIQIHGWVLMTNHIHLLITPSEDDAVSNLIQHIGRQYARPFNRRYNRSGALFQGRFRACLVQDSNYLLNCLGYIELNPVRAGITPSPAGYPWSSYHSHAFGKKASMQTYHESYLSLGETRQQRQQFYQYLLLTQLNPEMIAKIRHCTNTGLALGNQRFREQIQRMRE